MHNILNLFIFYYIFSFIISFSAFAQDTLPAFPVIHYHIITFEKQSDLKKFINEHKRTKSNIVKYRVITTLNRKELRFFRTKQKIVVPDTYLADLRAYSVFPFYYPEARDIPKLIVVSNVFQAYACYEYGRLVRFAAANTGKRSTPTYPGRYSLNWREKLRRSSFNEDWVMPFTWNFHLLTGSAFHQFEMLGYPVSHMCIRQFREDAEWLFYWGEGATRDSKGAFVPFSGTPVLIIDYYDFEKNIKKWLEVSSNKEKIDYLPAEPLKFDEALIPIVHIPPELRNIIPRKEKIRYLFAEDTLRFRGVIQRGTRLTPSGSMRITVKQGPNK
ncbi:MAG: L,D-transpeptidase [Candidatus Kapaibacteriales bacterium]